jgi:hypothetical protein
VSRQTLAATIESKWSDVAPHSPLSLTAAAVTLVSAVPEPNIDISHTTVDLDASRKALDAGEIVIHVTRSVEFVSPPAVYPKLSPRFPYRTDDLVDDSNAHQLLLSRLTHVKLDIQLDVAAGCLNVCGQRIPLTGDGGATEVAVVKAEVSLPRT